MELTITIISLCLTALVTMLGWTVSYNQAKKRDDRTRRIERELERLDRQIEEFYGPLFSLVRQIFNAFIVKDKIMKKGMERLSPDDKGTVERYVREHYFFPLHDQINQVLMSRMYLIGGTRIPESFLDYLEHMTQERLQHQLVTDESVDTSFVPWKNWPPDFYDDIREGLEQALMRQGHLLKGFEITR